MKNLINVFFLFLLLASTLGGYGQDKQVSLNRTDPKLVIDKFLSEQLGIYGEYENFEKAWIFQQEDGNYSLEIYYYEEGVLLREKKVLTPDAYQAYQSMVDLLIEERITKLSSPKPEKPRLSKNIDQSGRTELIVGNGLFALQFYGPSMIGLVSPENGFNNGRLPVATYLLTVSAAFFGPLLATKDKEVTLGESNLNLFGITRGAVYGLGLVGLIQPDLNSPKPVLFSTLALSVAGGVAGYQVAKANKLSAGTTTTIGVISDFGLVTLAGLGSTFVLNADINVAGRVVSGLGLLGAGLGMYGGYRLAQTQSYSQGDARSMRAAQVAAAFLPIGILLGTGDRNLSIDSDAEARLYILAGIAGAIGGTLFAHRNTRETDFSAREGTFIQLGTVASAALVSGLTFLVSPQDEFRPLPLMASLGAAGGYLLISNFYKKRQKEEKEGLSAFYMNVHPEGLLGGKLRERLRAGSPAGIPALSMGWRF